MIGLWLLLAALPLGAQFSATKTIARVEARAVDAAGSPLLGLEDRHFEVRDNDTPQKIDKVAREELPLDLAFVIDVSSSMKSPAAKEHKVFVSLSDTGRREYPQAKVSGRRQLKAD